MLQMKCASEVDTQNKFNAFFQKIFQTSRRILDTSLSGFFTEPTAKVVDEPILTWPHVIIPIKLKWGLRRGHNSALR